MAATSPLYWDGRCGKYMSDSPTPNAGFRPDLKLAPSAPMAVTNKSLPKRLPKGAVAVRLGHMTATGLTLLPDHNCQAPADACQAVRQFLDLIAEAIGRRDLPQTLTLAHLLAATGLRRQVDERRARGKGRVSVFDFKRAMRRAAA